MTARDWYGVLADAMSGPGHVDIASLGPDPEQVRAAGFAELALSARSEEDAPLFARVVVVSPPSRPATDAIRAAVTAAMVAAAVPEPVQATVHARLEHRHLRTFDAREVVAIARQLDAETVLYVESAAQLRYPDLDDAALPAPEPWLAHLARLTADLAGAVQEGPYVLLDTGALRPEGEVMDRALDGLDVGHIWVTVGDEPLGRAAAQAFALAEGADASSLARVLEQLDAVRPPPAPSVDAFVRAIALHRAGQRHGAWSLLLPHWSELVERARADSESLILLAQLASGGVDRARTAEALQAIDLVTASVELLEIALPIASDADEALGALIADRLAVVYPASRARADYLIAGPLGAGDWGELGRLLDDRSIVLGDGERAFLADLITHLATPSVDYEASFAGLTSAHEPYRDRIALQLGDDAGRRGRPADAFKLYALVAADGRSAATAAHRAMELLEQALLDRDEHGGFAMPSLALARIVAFIAFQVSRNPRVPSLRTHLARALSAEVVGARGDAVLASLLIGARPRLAMDAMFAVKRATDAEISVLLDAFARLAETPSHVALMIGVGELPPAVEPALAMGALPYLADLVEHVAGSVEDPGGVRALLGTLHFALLVCRRAAAPRRGLALVRLAVANLVSAGWTQEARDLAEHALSLFSEDAATMRIGWLTYAEVSHRTGDLHEALVRAVLASTFADVALDRNEVWQDDFLVTRLLRDVGLYDAAEAVLAHGVDALGEHATREPVSTRIEAIALSIAYQRIHRGGDPEQSQVLVTRLAANLERALELDDDILPPLTLLIQLIVRSPRPLDAGRDLGALVDAAAGRMPPSLRDYIASLRERAPRLAHIERLVGNKSAARFRDDVAFDVRAAALVARRALLRAPVLPVDEVLALLDLLTDRTLPATPAGPLVDVGRARAGIDALRGGGQHVVLLGLDELQRLVRLDVGADGNEVVVREDESVFSPAHFEAWRRVAIELRAGTYQFPFAYAFMDGPDHVMGDDVRRSVNDIGAGVTGTTPLAIVADVALQPFPLHLLRRDADFIGDLRPVCSVPSLEWIADALSSPPQSSSTRVAWVSDAVPDDPEGAAVLAPLADRLEAILTDHGIDLTRSAEPPPSLAGAGMAIVIAHGGLVPEQRYFQVVRDDARGRWSGRELTAALRGTDVVVLFVCSGGRLDLAPRGQAMVGLPRRLLASGCRAVVGSPWPLAVEVPPRWLPSFLDGLDAGATVTEAVFSANQAIARWTSGNPPHSLAMHLFGDPTVRVTARASSGASPELRGASR